MDPGPGPSKRYYLEIDPGDDLILQDIVLYLSMGYPPGPYSDEESDIEDEEVVPARDSSPQLSEGLQEMSLDSASPKNKLKYHFLESEIEVEAILTTDTTKRRKRKKTTKTKKTKKGKKTKKKQKKTMAEILAETKEQAATESGEYLIPVGTGDTDSDVSDIAPDPPRSFKLLKSRTEPETRAREISTGESASRLLPTSSSSGTFYNIEEIPMDSEESVTSEADPGPSAATDFGVSEMEPEVAELDEESEEGSESEEESESDEESDGQTEVESEEESDGQTEVESEEESGEQTDVESEPDQLSRSEPEPDRGELKRKLKSRSGSGSEKILKKKKKKK